jgi:hypothetical protein
MAERVNGELVARPLSEDHTPFRSVSKDSLLGLCAYFFLSG